MRKSFNLVVSTVYTHTKYKYTAVHPSLTYTLPSYLIKCIRKSNGLRIINPTFYWPKHLLNLNVSSSKMAEAMRNIMEGQ